MSRLRSSGGLLQQVFHREAGVRKRSSTAREKRKTYQHIVPNTTITNVTTPSCSFKRFTPDGSLLICFSPSSQAVEVYRFNGIACVPGSKLSNLDAWDRFFTHMYTTPALGWLCKDFCLVTECGRYMIVAGATHTTSSAPNPPGALPFISTEASRDTTFLVVRLMDGVVTERILFERDFIPLSHHAGVYLCGSRFIVLSIMNQTVHTFHITSEGRLLKVNAIGWHCYEDDEVIVEIVADNERAFEKHSHSSDATEGSSCKSGVVLWQSVPEEKPFVGHSSQNLALHLSSSRSAFNKASPLPSQPLGPDSAMDVDTSTPPVTGIRQRMMAFLLRRCYASPEPRKALQAFHANFEQYLSLVMERVQLLDEHRLLIRFCSPGDAIRRLLHSSEEPSKPFFMVFDSSTTEVLDFLDCSEQSMESLYRFYAAYAGNCSSRRHENDFIHSFWHNSSCEARRHASKSLLQFLPFTPQAWSQSPYFDQNLFDYDEKVIGAVQRPRQCTEYPIKFYCKETKELKFKIQPGNPEDGQSGRAFKVATYLFHPTLPFIASVQQTASVDPWVVNFHVRSEGALVA